MNNGVAEVAQNTDQQPLLTTKPVATTFKRKFNENEEQGHRGKLTVQEGFSWWTNMMLGVDSNSAQIVTRKLESNKVQK